MRRHLRIDGNAVRGAARGGRAPMLLSGIWDDGTTAAQLPGTQGKHCRDLTTAPARPRAPYLTPLVQETAT